MSLWVGWFFLFGPQLLTFVSPEIRSVIQDCVSSCMQKLISAVKNNEYEFDRAGWVGLRSHGDKSKADYARVCRYVVDASGGPHICREGLSRSFLLSRRGPMKQALLVV